MTFRFRLCAPLAALALTMAPISAPAQSADKPTLRDIITVENFATTIVHSMLSAARVLADITYDHVSVDPVGLRLNVVGLTVRPHLPGLRPGDCRIDAARATVAGRALDRLDQGQVLIALDEVSVGAGCLDREIRSMAQGMGLDPVTTPRLEIAVSYDYPSGGGALHLSADIDKLAAIEAHVDVDYISYRMDFEREEPRVAVDLASAHITIDDRGAFDLAKNFVPGDMMRPAAIQQMVGIGLREALSEANNGGALSDAQNRFADQAGQVAAGFETSQRRIVISTNVGATPVRLEEETIEDFRALFDALAPSVLDHAPQLDTALAAADVQSALDADGTPPNAFALGKALLTGLGAPRNRQSGLRLLLPLAQDGNTEASALMATALADRDPAAAYSHALRAAAAGEPGAMAVLDRVERELSFDAVMEEQNGAVGGPDPSNYSSVLAMRQAARNFLTGTGAPRSYRAAYYWSSMAAAAGDASALAMRDEIDELMRLRGDGAAWAEEAASLENGVLRDWLARNLPDALR